MRFIIQSLLLGAILVTASDLRAADTAAVENSPADYARVTQERAAKIVACLGITDNARAERATDTIAAQYRELSQIHEARDAKIADAKHRLEGDKPAQQGEIQKARDEAKVKTDELHKRFLGRLAAELTPGQVEQVKDGMTYSVAPNTYRVYLKMYPTMTDEQKKQVLDWLHEARELAMDEGDSKAKHGVFGKYKGRINNYLVKEGFDLKQGEQNLKKASALASEKKSQ